MMISPPDAVIRHLITVFDSKIVSGEDDRRNREEREDDGDRPTALGIAGHDPTSPPGRKGRGLRLSSLHVFGQVYSHSYSDKFVFYNMLNGLWLTLKVLSYTISYHSLTNL